MNEKKIQELTDTIRERLNIIDGYTKDPKPHYPIGAYVDLIRGDLLALLNAVEPGNNPK